MNDAIDHGFKLFPTAASSAAREIDYVFLFTTGVSVFFTLLVALAILVLCIRYRRGGPRDDLAGPATNHAPELGWTAALTVLFLAMFGSSAAVYARINAVPERAEQIHVLGKQWMWKFQYSSGRRTIDRLVVPQGEPVQLLMTSQDVIHSLYVPAFRLKQDVLPFRYSTLSFVATRIGEYHLFCAEYCGTEHSGMVGVVQVLPRQEYAQWRDGVTASVPPARRGEQLFVQYGCASCHFSAQRIAPDLRGVFGSEVRFTDGTSMTADAEYVRESILDPMRRVVLGFAPVMPSFQGRLSEEELLQLIAYVQSLQPGASP